MAYLLLGIGFLLVFLEFFLPGGIIGIAGGVLILMSIFFFARSVESGLAVALYVVGVLVLTGFLVRFALWKIRRGKRAQSIYLNTDQEGYCGAHFSKEMIGKRGEAFSDLKPSGHIVVEGKRLQAVSETGYLERGTPVQVIGGEGAHLIVKRIKKEGT